MGKLKREIVSALLSVGVPMSISRLRLETSTKFESRVGSILREMEKAQEVEWVRSMGENLRCGYQLTPIGIQNYSMQAMENKHGRSSMASVS